MSTEIDEQWLAEAVDRHRRIEDLQTRYTTALTQLEVTVRSADQAVEVRITAAGAIVDVMITEVGRGQRHEQLSAAMKDAVTAALDGATWARDRLRRDMFGDYHSLKES
jgi:DNA-binding protein YbaB